MMASQEVAAAADVEKQQQKPKETESDPLGRVKEKIAPGVNASLVLLYGVLSSMFIVGWVSLNSCPLNRMIPVYLIVAGVAGPLTKILIGTRNKYLFNLLLALVVFDFSWHGLGTYWVYREYQPNYDSLKGPYCNRTAYLLAFWMLNIQYTLLGLFLMLSLCYLLMRGDFRT